MKLSSVLVNLFLFFYSLLSCVTVFEYEKIVKIGLKAK